MIKNIYRETKKGKMVPLKVSDLKAALKMVKGDPCIVMYSDPEGNEEMSLYEIQIDTESPCPITLVPA